MQLRMDDTLTPQQYLEASHCGAVFLDAGLLLVQYAAIGAHLFWRLVGEAELEPRGGHAQDVAAATIRGNKHALGSIKSQR